MIIKYKYGFDFNGILYGWKSKELYRMPQNIGKRFYPLKQLELKTWNNGLTRGYLVGKKRKSLEQLKAMTIFINHEDQVILDENLPF